MRSCIIRQRSSDGAEAGFRDLVLTSLRGKLDEKSRAGKDWRTFAKAIQIATADLEENKEKFEADDARYQLIDLEEARSEGIMPIPYAAAP